MTHWIVVEWNQASGQPRIAFNGDLFYSEADAEDCADQMRQETAVVGRRERFTVHEINLEHE